MRTATGMFCARVKDVQRDGWQGNELILCVGIHGTRSKKNVPNRKYPSRHTAYNRADSLAGSYLA